MNLHARPDARVCFFVGISTVACALLGAFSGCTVDVGRGDARALPYVMFGGGATGLVLGACVGVRRYRHRDAQNEHIWPLAYGGAWLAAAMLSFGTAAIVALSHARTPVHVPIRLDRSGTLQVAFTADMTATYEVQLELEKTIPFGELDGFMGGFGGMKPDRPGPPRPQIDWSISGVAEADRNTYWGGTYYARDVVGLGLGDFRALKGRRYVITVTVNKPSPAIQVTHPHFQVQLGMAEWTDIYPRAMIAQLGGIIAIIIGIPFVVRGLRIRRGATPAACPEVGGYGG